MSQSAASENPIFQTVRREGTLTSRLIQQLEALMEDQKLRPGDKLPTERDMTQQFGVSRTVVREAVAALAAKGLLEPLPGGGAVIRTPDAESVSRSLYMLMRTGVETFSYDKVNEVRRLLEIEIAGLAAGRHNEEDMRQMEAALGAAIAGSQEREAWAHADVAFHAALARATHNELFPLLLDSISDVLLQVRESGFEVAGAQERALVQHRAIFAAVRAHDVEAARKAMEVHLHEAEEVQRLAQSIMKGTH